MKHHSLKMNFLFMGLQSTFWCSVCMFSSFFALHLKNNGYQEVEIGIIFAVSSVSALVGQFVWGSICYKKSWLSHKFILLVCIAAGILLNYLFSLSVEHFPTTLLLYAVFSISIWSMAPMIDAWTLYRKNDSPEINYGLTRGVASGMFALTAVIFGMLFIKLGLESIFMVSAIFLILAFIIVSIIHRGHSEVSYQMTKVAGVGGFRRLASNMPYAVLVMSSFLIFVAFMSSSSFYPLLITKLGGDSGHVGFGLFLMAVSEVPIMIVSIWFLKRYSSIHLLLVSFVFFLIKSALLAGSYNLNLAIWTQLTQSLSFGLFLPVCVAYITQIVKKSEVTLAYMILSSVTFGLGGLVGNTLGGFLTQFYGIRTLYVINVFITLLGLLVFVIFIIINITKHKMELREIGEPV